MFKLLARYAKPYVRYLVALVVMTLAQGAVQLFGLTQEMKSIVDKGIAAQNMDYLAGSGLAMLGFAALVAVLGAAIAYVGGRIACSMRRDMMHDAYDRILELSSQDVARFGEATLITRCISDTDNIQRLLGFLLGNCLLAPVIVVLMLGSLWQGDHEVFVAELVAVGLSVAIMLVLMGRSRRRFPALQESLDWLNLVTEEKIVGVRTIRAFGREEHEARRGEQADAQAFKNDVMANRPLKFVSPSILSIMNFSMVLVYWVGAAKTQAGLVQLSSLLLTIQYVNALISPLSALPIIVNMVPGAEVGCVRLAELLDYRPTTAPTPTTAPASPAPGEVVPGEVPTREKTLRDEPILAFEDVSFGYQESASTLAHLSFALFDGERVGVVGATGSGKSTLLSLMCGLYTPQDGVIRVAGVPLESMDKAARTRTFAYVPQKAMVFQDSVRENIRAYHGDVSDTAMARASEAAVFDEVIDVLEDGLDTRMAQGGMNLSGGQRKRLSLARGLAKDARIYVLDDPFAALDAVTERTARRRTLELLVGKTVVMVAQRFQSIVDFDRIIVMREGTIAAMGTHDELLESCEEYADMYRTQCYLERE